MAKRKKGRPAARGPSNRGRPRKSGDRYPGGKLRPQPVEPNDRVMKERREMLGDESLNIAVASDPLDFALAKGFLTEARFNAAMAFARLHDLARLGGPRTGRGGPAEAATTVGADERPRDPNARNEWDRMDRKQIATVFDAVFNVTGAADAEQSAKAALIRWKAANAVLTPAQRDELFEVCVLRSWPQWINWMAAGKDVPPTWDRKRVLLEDGLDLVAEAMKANRRPQAA